MIDILNSLNNLLKENVTSEEINYVSQILMKISFRNVPEESQTLVINFMNTVDLTLNQSFSILKKAQLIYNSSSK